MGKTRLVIIMALLCMAVACREAHIEGSNAQVFNDSLMAMYLEHSVTDAQDFGQRLIAAQDARGAEAVRRALNGKNWSEANAYLDEATAKNSPPHSNDPAKG